MATSRSQETICSLVEDGTLILQTEADCDPNFRGLVVSADKLIVLDDVAGSLHLYSRYDGKLQATSHELKSSPVCVCRISNTEVAVILYNSEVVILSFESTDDVKRVKTLDVMTGLYESHAVAKVESIDRLIVSGRKLGMMGMYWCVVSLIDGHVDSMHQICKGGFDSHLAIKNSMVYISCRAFDPTDNGVYAYDIFNSHTQLFLYQHSELNSPQGLTVDTRGFIFVCNPYSIHQLTERGELVTIHRVSSLPCEIFYEDQDRVLYIKKWGSNEITRYRLEYLHQQGTGVPMEILNMDDRSIQLFEEALKDGKETVCSIRVMVVGHMGVGKSTLIKRLLGEEVNISERHSTEGIDVYVNCCDVSLSTREWTRRTKDSEHYYQLQRLARILNEQRSRQYKVADEEQVIIHSLGKNVAVKDGNTEILYRRSHQQDFGQDLSSTTSQQAESFSALVQRNLTQSETNTIAMIKLLQENADKLKQDTGKTSPLTMWDFAGQYAFYTTHQTFLTRRAIYLLVSDVSGQVTDLVADECYLDSEGIMKCKVYELIDVWLNSIHSCAPSPEASIPPVILVGTHVDKILQKQSLAKGRESETQTMMSGTVELTLPTTSTSLTTAASDKPIRGAVKKIFKQRKSKGIVEATSVSSMTGAHALPVEGHLKEQKKSRLWPWRKKRVNTDVMAAPSTEKPVGEMTLGVDAGKSSHYEICERYFGKIRAYLNDKPTRFHLIDEDFAIDNTVVDSKLEDLKRKIVEVASQQPYWREEIPARWIPLEQELMRRKAAGVKVISRKDVETINKEGTVRIEKSEELDLFLRFLHDTGTIIYFSIEVLRDNIVLDPTWLIDALKSLINAQPNLPKSLADNGFQTDRTSDSAATQRWSDFKEKGILTLELVDEVWTKEKYPELHANKNHILLIMEQLNIIAKPRSFSEIGEKVENYFLTPCMLRQESPRDIVSPQQDPLMVSTSVLCCVFTGRFLPPPIFHRLIAACVARWPVAKKKETSENLIFCGCCVFNLDLFHRLTLHCRNHIVFARITRMVIDEVKTPDGKLCTRVRKFITLNLSKITSYLGQNLQYELRIQSPSFRGVSEDGMIGFSPPFQIWFTEEGQDSDAPIIHENINYARLCIAFATVCGNALREILLTHVPAPHTNIYQAILANQTNLTSRRHGRQANLNQVQNQVVFPDPRGQYMAAVDQFDISLLYTLIRNVSTVPVPLRGWDIDPPDQPRDRTLGANVERIRLYRNLISGHSAHGQISQQDFEDYWNKIDAVLHDIEDVIGGHIYSLELDKQKRQVITSYEAC